MKDMVEKKLQGFLDHLEDQIRSYLEWCSSPAAKLLLLEFLQIPGAQPTWRRLENNTHPSGFSEAVAADAEGDRKPGMPTGLVWLDSWTHFVVYDHERKNQCCRLIPKFRAQDATGEMYSVDFALFWPRNDGKGHFKIAIQCDGEADRKTTTESEKWKKLEKQGWIVLRIPVQKIHSDPVKVIEQIRELALEENTRCAKERRTGH